MNRSSNEAEGGGELSEEALPKKTLVWHKVPVGGFIPSGREGHSSVGANMKMYIFGGMETGRRVNTMQVLDIATGHWSNNVVGNRDLRIDAEIHKDATSTDDIDAHKGIGKAASIDENADFDPDAVESKNPNVPTPRTHHASCLLEFEVEINQVQKKRGRKQKVALPPEEPVTKRMQLMIVHGGEGTVIEDKDDAEDEANMKNSKSHVHFNNDSKLTRAHKHGKTKGHAKGALRDTQFGHTLNVGEYEMAAKKREDNAMKRAQEEESRMMTEMDNKLEGMSRSASAPGGVCVKDTLQNFGHKTGGLRVDKQKSAHLKDLAGATDATSKNISSLQHNQQMVLSAQSVVPLEDIFALDVNNGEWIKFETIMGPLPRKGHSLSIAPVSRAALGMGASGDSLDPDRILMNRDKRLGRIHNHQSIDPDDDEDLKPDPRVQSVMLFGGFNNEHEAYSNTVHLATVENIASSYINLNQMVQDERAMLNKEEGGDTDSDSGSESADPSVKSKKGSGGDAAWQLQKEMIKQQNAIKWQVVQTTGTPPSPRYRHSATIVRKRKEEAHHHHHTLAGRQSESCTLVIFGGLGRGNVPMNDVHILDLDTLHWTNLTGSDDTWPSHGLFGHTAIPHAIKGMWLKRSETEGEVEDDDVFGNIPLSAAARMAARAAGASKKGSIKDASLLPGTEAFGESSNALAPEEEMSMYQDVLIVYGGSGGSEEDNAARYRTKKAGLVRHYVNHVPPDHGPEHYPDEEEEIPLDLETREKVARESGASHVTRVLDLTTGEWRELHGSISYPSQRVNHSIALVNGWAPGNPARIPIRVGEAHHMNSLPPAPELGSTKKSGAADGDVGATAGTAVNTRGPPSPALGADDEGDERDSCAVIFGGSSLAMCPPDAWVLDLKWRVAGVKGFDSHATSRTRDALTQSIEWSKRTQYATGSTRHLKAAMHHHESHTLHMAADGTGRDGTHIDLELDPNYSTLNHRMTSSGPGGYPGGYTGPAGASAGTVNFTHLHLSPQEIESQYEELTAAFRRVKKERAYAELQIKKERERSFECLLRADRAERELKQVNREYATHRARTSNQIGDLEGTIETQNEALAKLKQLSDELMLERAENEKVINALVLAARAQRADEKTEGKFKVKTVF